MKKSNIFILIIILFVSPLTLRAQHATTFGGNANPAAIHTIRLSTGVQLEYAESGDSEGLPVILLHGLTDSRHSYDGVLAFLPVSMHIYVLSQRGHGNSSKTPSSYMPGDFADDIRAFMKELNIRQAVLVGHSMGSTIVQCFAVKYPELVKGIVLMGAFANYDKPVVKAFKQEIDALNDPVDSSFAAEFQKSTIVKPIPEEMLVKFIGESLKVPSVIWKAVVDGLTTSEFIGGLKKFDKPALIVWGDKDPLCTRADQEVLNAAIRKSNLLVYEGTGHALHWEEPERFAKDLVIFISHIR